MLVEIQARVYTPQRDDDEEKLDAADDPTIQLHPNCVIADV